MPIDPSPRSRRLYDELAFALSRLDRVTLGSWGKHSATRLGHLAGRRVGGVAQVASRLAKASSREAQGLMHAVKAGRAGAHVGDRTAAAIDGTLALGKDGAALAVGLAHALQRDPKTTAPALLGALLGFSAGSGGLDGNGGIPDLDLLAGIGWHRSPITHSLIAGVLAEGLLLALADLAARLHDRLPVDHDPLWDTLAAIGRPLAGSLAVGTSAGLAWHLWVDAIAQPGAYHRLPIELPLEAHQTILAANGTAEGVDALRRAAPHLGETIDGGRPQATPGRKFVNAVAGVGRRVRGAVTGS